MDDSRSSVNLCKHQTSYRKVCSFTVSSSAEEHKSLQELELQDNGSSYFTFAKKSQSNSSRQEISDKEIQSNKRKNSFELLTSASFRWNLDFDDMVQRKRLFESGQQRSAATNMDSNDRDVVSFKSSENPPVFPKVGEAQDVQASSCSIVDDHPYCVKYNPSRDPDVSLACCSSFYSVDPGSDGFIIPPDHIHNRGSYERQPSYLISDPRPICSVGNFLKITKQAGTNPIHPTIKTVPEYSDLRPPLTLTINTLCAWPPSGLRPNCLGLNTVSSLNRMSRNFPAHIYQTSLTYDDIKQRCSTFLRPTTDVPGRLNHTTFQTSHNQYSRWPQAIGTSLFPLPPTIVSPGFFQVYLFTYISTRVIQ